METILEFGTKRVKPTIRTLFDMKDVIYDREWLRMANNIELYYMYRELALSKNDTLTMKEHNLRYDITVIPPLMLGCEFVKTAGQYHPKVPGTDMTFSEIYEVLSGEAQYLGIPGNPVTTYILILSLFSGFISIICLWKQKDKRSLYSWIYLSYM